MGGQPLQGCWKQCNKEPAIAIATTYKVLGVRSDLFLFVMLCYNLHYQTFYSNKKNVSIIGYVYLHLT